MRWMKKSYLFLLPCFMTLSTNVMSAVRESGSSASPSSQTEPSTSPIILPDHDALTRAYDSYLHAINLSQDRSFMLTGQDPAQVRLVDTIVDKPESKGAQVRLIIVPDLHFNIHKGDSGDEAMCDEGGRDAAAVVRLLTLIASRDSAETMFLLETNAKPALRDPPAGTIDDTELESAASSAPTTPNTCKGIADRVFEALWNPAQHRRSGMLRNVLVGSLEMGAWSEVEREQLRTEARSLVHLRVEQLIAKGEIKKEASAPEGEIGVELQKKLDSFLIEDVGTLRSLSPDNLPEVGSAGRFYRKLLTEEVQSLLSGKSPIDTWSNKFGRVTAEELLKIAPTREHFMAQNIRNCVRRPSTSLCVAILGARHFLPVATLLSVH